jgi:sucrose-6-phosphate hydrolase SacC (GH32 family)
LLPAVLLLAGPLLHNGTYHLFWQNVPHSSEWSWGLGWVSIPHSTHG